MSDKAQLMGIGAFVVVIVALLALPYLPFPSNTDVRGRPELTAEVARDALVDALRKGDPGAARFITSADQLAQAKIHRPPESELVFVGPITIDLRAREFRWGWAAPDGKCGQFGRGHFEFVKRRWIAK